MTEGSTPPEEGETPPVSEPSSQLRRSQRPQIPLTHRMNLNQVRQEFFKAGLYQPELERRKHPRSERPPASPQPPRRSIEDKKMDSVNEQPSPKPGVSGTQQTQTQPPQPHVAYVVTELSYGQKCAMNGGTAIVSGTALMLIWKGLTRWLG